MADMRLVSLSILTGIVLIGAGCSPEKPSGATVPPTSSETNKPAEPSKVAEAPTAPATENLIKEDVVAGKGTGAVKGDLVLVTYTGKLMNGTQFDSNSGPEGKPFPLRLGMGSVIKGWEEGLIGMKAGGERNLTIPYAMAYGPEGKPPTIPAKSDLKFNVKMLHIVKMDEGGIYDRKDLKPGSGRAVKAGDKISVHYTGTYVNGLKFDSSRDRKEPFSFTVGKGEVIPGWDAGVVGMKVGGRRELIVPPDLAYGSSPQNPIGADQVLRFDIELLKIQ